MWKHLDKNFDHVSAKAIKLEFKYLPSSVVDCGTPDQEDGSRERLEAKYWIARSSRYMLEARYWIARSSHYRLEAYRIACCSRDGLEVTYWLIGEWSCV
jgi:hypothetical protein